MPEAVSEKPISNPYGPAKLPYAQRHSYIQYEAEDGSCGEVAFPVNFEELYHLKGRLLTLIDATFTDVQQRKAQKDVVWNTLRDWMEDIQRSQGWSEIPAGEGNFLLPEDEG